MIASLSVEQPSSQQPAAQQPGECLVRRWLAANGLPDVAPAAQASWQTLRGMAGLDGIVAACLAAVERDPTVELTPARMLQAVREQGATLDVPVARKIAVLTAAGVKIAGKIAPHFTLAQIESALAALKADRKGQTLGGGLVYRAILDNDGGWDPAKRHADLIAAAERRQREAEQALAAKAEQARRREAARQALEARDQERAEREALARRVAALTDTQRRGLRDMVLAKLPEERRSNALKLAELIVATPELVGAALEEIESGRYVVPEIDQAAELAARKARMAEQLAALRAERNTDQQTDRGPTGRRVEPTQ